MLNHGRAALLRGRCGGNAQHLEWLQFFLSSSSIKKLDMKKAPLSSGFDSTPAGWF
jgi:hypothetical protein